MARCQARVLDAAAAMKVGRDEIEKNPDKPVQQLFNSSSRNSWSSQSARQVEVGPSHDGPQKTDGRGGDGTSLSPLLDENIYCTRTRARWINQDASRDSSPPAQLMEAP
jgi:hypothetical protein